MDKRLVMQKEAGEQKMRLARARALLDAGRQGGVVATAAIFNTLRKTVAGVRRSRGNNVEATSRVVSWSGDTANENHSDTRAELEAAVARAQAAWQKASDELDRSQIDRDKAMARWDKVVDCQSTAGSNRRKPDVDRRNADEILGKLIPDQRDSDAERRKVHDALADFARIVAERHEAFIERNNAETAWSNAAADLISAIAKRKKAIAALEELNRAEGRQ